MENILLYTHILFGSIALIIGLIILLKKKGTPIHINYGKIYHASMIANGMSALILSVLNPNYFLFMVAIFSMYMAESGRCIWSLKKGTNSLYNRMLSYIMLNFGLLFIIYGVYLLIESKSLGIVLCSFGGISLLLVRQDLTTYQKGKFNYPQLTRLHIGKMIGSYIAAFTAFLVVNNTILPGIVAWLLPTILFVPLIIFWTRKYAP
ncbi:MAG: hypothetical protein IPM42_20490 [Saprospiraceae bacterium]|nr:hypothetical protein [Saprospiraceae bacterium]